MRHISFHCGVIQSRAVLWAAMFSLVVSAANAANFTCSWGGVTGNWTNATDWSGCNGTFPDNGGGNTYDATISTGTSQLTTAISIGNTTISGSGSWALSGGATAMLSGGLSNSVFAPGGLSVDLFGPGGTLSSGGSTLTIASTLTNSGVILLGNGAISAPANISAAALDNMGDIVIQSSASAQSTLRLGSGLTSLDGLLELYGTNSQVQLIGKPTNNSALTNLSNVTGGLDLADGASLTTAGNLTNLGGIEVHDGGGVLNIGGRLTNQGNVTLGSIGSSSPSTLTVTGLGNSGTIQIQGNASNAAGQANFIVNGAANNAGFVEIDTGGKLSVTGGYTQGGFGETIVDGTLSAASVDIANGTLEGSGTVNGNVSNAGAVQPGLFGSDILSVDGNYVQNSEGALWIFLEGSESSQLAVSGSAALDGDLLLSLLGSSLVAGDSFDIMSFLSVSGDFRSLSFNGNTCISDGTDIWDCAGELPGRGGFIRPVFEEVFQPNGLVLDVVSEEVPEPGSLGLLGTGIGLLFIVRRRKRRVAIHST